MNREAMNLGVHFEVPIRGDGGDRQASEWILARLPSSPCAMLSMAASLKQERARVEGRGNGLALQCASVITGTWLASSPPALRGKSMLFALARGSGGPFKLPVLGCTRCGMMFPVSANARLHMCVTCRAAHRREWDRRRQADRRAI